jgi:hypothetical protein
MSSDEAKQYIEDKLRKARAILAGETGSVGRERLYEVWSLVVRALKRAKKDPEVYRAFAPRARSEAAFFSSVVRGFFGDQRHSLKYLYCKVAARIWLDERPRRELLSELKILGITKFGGHSEVRTEPPSDDTIRAEAQAKFATVFTSAKFAMPIGARDAILWARRMSEGHHAIHLLETNSAGVAKSLRKQLKAR